MLNTYFTYVKGISFMILELKHKVSYGKINLSVIYMLHLANMCNPKCVNSDTVMSMQLRSIHNIEIHIILYL